MKRFKGLMVAMLAGTVMLAAPVFAQGRGGHGGGGFSRGGSFSGARGFSGGGFSGSRGFSGGGGEQHFSGHSFGAPARGFNGGGRGFEGRDFEHGDHDHGHFGGGGLGFGVGVYPGYAYPYTYGYADPYYYDPGYVEPPYYAAPAPAQACSGYYDAYGNWVPDPNCQVPPTPPSPYGY